MGEPQSAPAPPTRAVCVRVLRLPLRVSLFKLATPSWRGQPHEFVKGTRHEPFLASLLRASRIDYKLNIYRRFSPPFLFSSLPIKRSLSLSLFLTGLFGMRERPSVLRSERLIASSVILSERFDPFAAIAVDAWETHDVEYRCLSWGYIVRARNRCTKKYQPEMTLNRLKVNEEQVVAEKLEIEREREYARATTTAYTAPLSNPLERRTAEREVRSR